MNKKKMKTLSCKFLFRPENLAFFASCDLGMQGGEGGGGFRGFLINMHVKKIRRKCFSHYRKKG